jgi:hypothetical protein
MKKKSNKTVIPEDMARIFELFVEVSMTYILDHDAFFRLNPAAGSYR